MASFLDGAERLPTLCERLREHARSRPTEVAFGFLARRGASLSEIRHEDLLRRVRRAAGAIARVSRPREPVVCLFEPGPDFVIGFLGCLWAGRIAVPVAPPRPNENPEGVVAIIAHSGARAALAAAEVAASLQLAAGHLIHAWIDGEGLDCAFEIEDPCPDPADLALLQYTSGSTGAPKGVMVGHDNLAANACQIAASFEHGESSVALTWLPPQHDMGLIGGIVHPLYVGFRSYLMSPVEMIRNPLTWLQAVSSLGVTTSGAPNFGYELCVKRISADKRSMLDLSRWSIAFCGAEPISMHTLDRFAAAFSACGFRRDAFFPCYGLAEATLQATGIAKAESPRSRAAADEPTVEQVDCGRAVARQELLIWEERRNAPAPDGTRGEIWLRGPNVAKGYWNDHSLTKQVFGQTGPDGEGQWLRTGDIGYVLEGSLHVCGRRKAQIIIRGKNYSLEELEWIANAAVPELRGYICAGYPVQDMGEERLVIVQEAPRPARTAEMEAKLDQLVRGALVRRHGISPHEVRLVSLGSIPRTRSGKIQRHLCVLNHGSWA